MYDLSINMKWAPCDTLMNMQSPLSDMSNIWNLYAFSMGSHLS